MILIVLCWTWEYLAKLLAWRLADDRMLPLPPVTDRSPTPTCSQYLHSERGCLGLTHNNKTTAPVKDYPGMLDFHSWTNAEPDRDQAVPSRYILL
jgi:hypothetical protein